MTDQTTIKVLSDEQRKELLEYAKNPWVTIKKIAIITGNTDKDIIIEYIDFFKGSKTVII